MVKATGGLDMEVVQVEQNTTDNITKKMKVVFPKTEKEHIDFLN